MNQAPSSAGIQRYAVDDSCPHGYISELLLRCGDGDESALLRLMDIFYSLAVASTAARVATCEIDRCVAAGFASIWKQAPLYRPDRESAVAWVMRHVGVAADGQRGLAELN